MDTRNIEKSMWKIPVCKNGMVHNPFSVAQYAEDALKHVEKQVFGEAWLEENDDWEIINDPDEIELIDEDGIPF